MTLIQFLLRHGDVRVCRVEPRRVDERFQASWAPPGCQYLAGHHAVGQSPEHALAILDGYLHRNRLSSYAQPANFQAGASCNYCEGYASTKYCEHAPAEEGLPSG